MRSKWLLSLALLTLLTGGVRAQDKTFDITVTAGKHDYKNVPVVVPLSVPKDLAFTKHVNLTRGNGRLQGQLTFPGLTTDHIKPGGDGLVRLDLHFVLPELKAGDTTKLTLT